MSVRVHGEACAGGRDEGDQRQGKARKTWDTRQEASSPCDACGALYPNKSRYWDVPAKGIWVCWDCAPHVSVEWLEEEPGESPPERQATLAGCVLESIANSNKPLNWLIPLSRLSR